MASAAEKQAAAAEAAEAEAVAAAAAAEAAEAAEAEAFEAALAAEEAETAAAAAAASDADVAARAAAIAALAGGDAGEGAPGGGEDVPAAGLPAGTGQVLEWGGDVPYMVVSTLFNAMVDGWHQTAYQGDVVKPTVEFAGRGVNLRCLVLHDEG